MVGSTKDGANLATYRKISMLASYIIFIFITSLLILNIVLYRITIVWKYTADNYYVFLIDFWEILWYVFFISIDFYDKI
jgi:hypothetical protein